MPQSISKAPAVAVLRRSFSRDTLRELKRAADYCRARGGQLTDLRRLIFGVLLQRRTPIGAYEIIQILSQFTGKTVAPPTVYRAVDFLIQMGLVARVASRNSFIACAHPGHDHDCVFFICRSCGSAEEVEDKRLDALISNEAQGIGFKPIRRVLEIEGICRECRI
jgi:Fur family transcriptional regulator, zinc uptake regulator